MTKQPGQCVAGFTTRPGFMKTTPKTPPTRQDIFNRVWKRFIVNRRKFGVNHEEQVCSYTAGCAVGFLMPPKMRKAADARPSDMRVVSLLPDSILVESGFNLDDRPFLRRLQMAHDDAALGEDQDHEPREAFRRSLAFIAQVEGLTIPA